MKINTQCVGAGLLTAILCLCPGLFAQNAQETAAKQILSATGVRGGLLVHLNCGDGQLTAAFGANEHFTVQGWDANADNVQKTRELLQKSGAYGRVSADRFDGKRLPYAENLVNLLVAENLGSLSKEEALRVLAPGGVLYAKQGGNWEKTVKTRPADIDEWTHFMHDAGGNPVAHDQQVGPPGRLQWTADPQFTRSHEHTPSIWAVVSAGGRLFYILDEGPTASVRLSPKWMLIARDAFNGVILWKKPLENWYPHLIGWTQNPPELERRVVAVGDRVYVTLGLHSAVSVLDAATGEVVRTLENSVGAESIAVHQGVVLLTARAVTPEKTQELENWRKLVLADKSPVFTRDTAGPSVTQFRKAERTGEESLLAFDAASGKLLWKKTGADAADLKLDSVCASANMVFYERSKERDEADPEGKRNAGQGNAGKNKGGKNKAGAKNGGNGGGGNKGGEVFCVDLKTGNKLWSASTPTLRFTAENLVICGSKSMLAVLSADTGKPRWMQPTEVKELRDIFVVRGSFWECGFQPAPDKRSDAWGPYYVIERDLATGAIKSKITPENPSHHHRCYQNKATDRFILGGRRGTEFIDFSTHDVLWNSWARGVCRYGVMPANGLLYVPPHACACYMAAKLTGFNVMASWQPPMPAASQSADDELERGPAYADLASLKSSGSKGWAMYRSDAERSGAVDAPISAKLQTAWETKVAARTTPPTVADGLALVAVPDEYAVVAVEAASGKTLWRFTAGARIDSPPTLDRGLAIFGCRDGYVYAVRMKDGALAWRFRAARTDRRIVVNGLVESASPVHGSVVVQDGVVYATAGRSSYLDGGVDLVRIDARTGKKLSRTPIYSPDPKTGKQPAQKAPYDVPGERSDLLSADAGHVYLRDLVFNSQGAPEAKGNHHLFSLTSFLDDNWTHRGYWIFGDHVTYSSGCCKQEAGLIFGRVLVFDRKSIFGYGRKQIQWSNQLEDGPYRLFAVKQGDHASLWNKTLSIQVKAMALAGNVLLVAGPPAEVLLPQTAPRQGPKGFLYAFSTTDGSQLAEFPLPDAPKFDALAVADGRVYLALENGALACFK